MKEIKKWKYNQKVDEEEQRRIDEEVRKRQQKKRNAYKCKCRSIWYI